MMKKINFQLLPLMLLVSAVCSCDDGGQKPRQASTLYFAGWNGKEVGVVDINNPNKLSVIANTANDGLEETGAIAIDFENNMIYLSEEYNNRILRKKLDGTGTLEVLYDQTDGINGPSAIDLDVNNNRIYWINAESKRIMYGSLDGSASPSTLPFGNVDAISYSYSLQLDLKHKKLYVADYDSGILVGNLDGTGTMKKLYPVGKANVSKPKSLTLDVTGNKIYWADELTQSILVAPLDGSGTPTTLVDVGAGTTNSPIAIAIDKIAKRIYWAEYPSNVVAFRMLDGTGSRSILLEGVESYCIRLNNP